MENRQFIFNGQRFELPSDFEKAFKPTKWSIQKYIHFVSHLTNPIRMQFISLTKDVLESYYKDNDTQNFLHQINKRFGHPFKDYDRDNYNVRVPLENAKEFIETIGLMKKNGTIIGNASSLAKIIQEQFGIKYSLSTIKDILYKVDKI